MAFVFLSKLAICTVIMHLIAYFKLGSSTDYDGSDYLQEKIPVFGLGRHFVVSSMYSLPITRHAVGRRQVFLELSQHHCLVCRVCRDDGGIYTCAEVQG